VGATQSNVPRDLRVTGWKDSKTAIPIGSRQLVHVRTISYSEGVGIFRGVEMANREAFLECGSPMSHLLNKSGR